MKRGLRLLQSSSARAQQPDRHAHVVRQPDEPLLTEREAAERCRWFDRGCLNPVRAFQKWARRQGVPYKSAGRARLYRWSELQAFLDRLPWTRRHADQPTRRPSVLKGHVS